MLDTIRLSDDLSTIIILDQTKLPLHEEYIELKNADDVYHAIRNLEVRGAPLIGVCAAYGLYISLLPYDGDKHGFEAFFEEKKAYLASSRPTAVNLFWALDRMERVMRSSSSLSVDERVARLLAEAEAIHQEDVMTTRRIGENGFPLIAEKRRILTHCNAGALATSGIGTALAPVYIALEKGVDDISVYCSETRPLLQGARLSSFEMKRAGVDTYVLSDNMVSYLMSKGSVDIVITGADRIAANGDTANKIGTSSTAILASYYGIPFYVAAPTSTIDLSIATGDDIPIEERDGREVTEFWYRERMAAEGVSVVNPAFDVTSASLISGIITEYGIARPPYSRSLGAMCR